MRYFLGTIFILCGLGYAISISFNLIPEENRMDTVSLLFLLICIVIGVFLYNPELFEKLKSFEISGLKFELASVVHKQQKHEEQLADLNTILPLLLPEGERNHLVNLLNNDTKGYKGGYSLRTELRHLRSIKLIKLKESNIKKIGELRNKMEFDLSEHITLTESGLFWAKKVLENESFDDEI